MTERTTLAALSTSGSTGISRRSLARVTGGLYLAFVALLALADVFSHLGPGDADQVLKSLENDPTRFAFGLTLGMLSAFVFVLAAWGLFVLLRPVNRDLALLFLLLNAIGAAIQVASYLPVLVAMLAEDASGVTAAFSGPQIQALQHLVIDVHKVGFASAQLFFGAWLFPLGYLVYRSGFLPKFLGVLLILDGVAVVAWFVQALLLPENPGLVTPGLLLSFVAETGLGLWLLVKGIKVERAVSDSGHRRDTGDTTHHVPLARDQARIDET